MLNDRKSEPIALFSRSWYRNKLCVTSELLFLSVSVSSYLPWNFSFVLTRRFPRRRDRDGESSKSILCKWLLVFISIVYTWRRKTATRFYAYFVMTIVSTVATSPARDFGFLNESVTFQLMETIWLSFLTTHYKTVIIYCNNIAANIETFQQYCTNIANVAAMLLQTSVLYEIMSLQFGEVTIYFPFFLVSSLSLSLSPLKNSVDYLRWQFSLYIFDRIRSNWLKALHGIENTIALEL